jgi:ATP-dependent protease HslVU (ClpYQ) peptidase subunit
MNKKNVKWKSNLIYKRGTPRMTIIAAVKFNVGIVIASDSQVTIGDCLKRIDERKISEVEIAHNLKFIFAGAGESRLIRRAREQLILECRKREINSLLDFKDTCEDVVKFIKRRYMEDENIRDEQQYPNLEFLVGVLINEELGLLRLYPDGIADNISNYDVIGSGELFAEYIYSRLDKDNLSAIEAVNTVLYVVEEIKEIDPNCSGPTTISILFAKGDKGEFFKYEDIDSVINERTKILQKSDDEMKPFWQKMIRNPFEIPILDASSSPSEQLSNDERKKQENNK